MNDLRRELAETLDRRDIPDGLWGYLCGGYPVDVAMGDVAELAGQVRHALTIAQYFERDFRHGEAHLAEPGEKALRGLDGTPRLDSPQRDRALAISDVLAMEAQQDGAVCAFRATVLGGQLLTLEEAHAFLDSHAAAFFPFEEFVKDGVPLVGHTVTVDPEERLIQVGSPFVPRAEFTLWIEPPGVQWSCSIGNDEDLGTLVLPVFAPMKRTTVIRLHSVLGTLYRLSEGLARRYSWELDAAVSFVLLGTVPYVAAVRGELVTHRRGSHEHFGIRIDASPWVPAGVVQRVFRQLQRELLGTENRQLEAKNIALFRFVTEQESEHGKRPAWRDLQRSWNQEYPEWQYSEAYLLSRDYRATSKRILEPQWSTPSAGKRRAKGL